MGILKLALLICITSKKKPELSCSLNLVQKNKYQTKMRFFFSNFSVSVMIIFRSAKKLAKTSSFQLTIHKVSVSKPSVSSRCISNSVSLRTVMNETFFFLTRRAQHAVISALCASVSYEFVFLALLFLFFVLLFFRFLFCLNFMLIFLLLLRVILHGFSFKFFLICFWLSRTQPVLSVILFVHLSIFVFISLRRCFFRLHFIFAGFFPGLFVFYLAISNLGLSFQTLFDSILVPCGFYNLLQFICVRLWCGVSDFLHRGCVFLTRFHFHIETTSKKKKLAKKNTMVTREREGEKKATKPNNSIKKVFRAMHSPFASVIYIH